MFGSMMNLLKDKAEQATKRLSGKKDALEGACAAIALVASADGQISEAEINEGVKAAKSSTILAGAFSAREIEDTAVAMMTRASSRIGRNGLYREVDDCARMDQAIRDDIMLIAVEVADEGGKGEIDPNEQRILRDIAGRLSVNLGALGITL